MLRGGVSGQWICFSVFFSTAISLRDVFSTMWRRIAEFLMGGGGASSALAFLVFVIKIPPFLCYKVFLLRSHPMIFPGPTTT